MAADQNTREFKSMNRLSGSLVTAASLLFISAAIGEETSGPDCNKDNWEDFYPDLRDCNLREANLEDADLEDVISGGIKGKPSSLPDYWVLKKGYLIGPGADLSGANLTGANLSEARPMNADFSGATVGGAHLLNWIWSHEVGNTITTLYKNPSEWAGYYKGVKSGGIKGRPSSLPYAYKLRNGYLIGPGARPYRC